MSSLEVGYKGEINVVWVNISTPKTTLGVVRAKKNVSGSVQSENKTMLSISSREDRIQRTRREGRNKREKEEGAKGVLWKE